MNYTEVEVFCLRKWEPYQDDLRIKHFTENLSTFNQQLPDSIDSCTELMLRRFDYYSHSKVNEGLIELHQKLLKQPNIDLQYTTFAVLKSQRERYNSSYEHVREYKIINNLSDNNITPSVSDWFNRPEWQYLENVVFLDDMCGTGKTFIEYFKKHIDYLKDKKIYYVIIHIMTEAKTRIEKFAKDNSLNIYILSYNETAATFSMPELKDYRDTFQKECENLGIKKLWDVFGYKYDNSKSTDQLYSESLVSFYLNTPNNTLGLFRCKTDKLVALFPRETKEKPAWMTMNERKAQKSRSNYFCKSRRYSK